MEEDLKQLKSVVEQLPPEQAKQVLNYAMALHRQNNVPDGQGSGESWTRAAAIASLLYFDSLHPEDDWSDLIEPPGAK